MNRFQLHTHETPAETAQRAFVETMRKRLNSGQAAALEASLQHLPAHSDALMRGFVSGAR
jgi:hypothetical protein